MLERTHPLEYGEYSCNTYTINESDENHITNTILTIYLKRMYEEMQSKDNFIHDI